MGSDSGFVGYCPAHNKRLYSKRGARRTIRRLHATNTMREYRCTEVAGLWHIGHLAQSVKKGEISAADLYTPRKAPHVQPVDRRETGPLRGVREAPHPGVDETAPAVDEGDDGGGGDHAQAEGS